jgi:hypothetical protein
LLAQSEPDSKNLSRKKKRNLPNKNYAEGAITVLPQQAIVNWPELKNHRENDVVITFEYCCDCHKHEGLTWHKESQYLEVLLSF